MRPPGTSADLEQRRCRAIELLEQGHSHRAVAKMVHSSLSSVVRWQQAYRAEGQEGLRSVPALGRPPMLSEKEKKKLVSSLVFCSTRILEIPISSPLSSIPQGRDPPLRIDDSYLT